MLELAWAGLGSFGFPMAVRAFQQSAALVAIVSSGHCQSVEKVCSLGIPIADTIPSSTDVLCLCLPTPTATREFIETHEKSLPRLIIDFGTGDPSETLSFAKDLAKQNTVFLDAPVSGSKAMAEAGELTIMAGCSRDEIHFLAEIFSYISKTVIYCGCRSQGNKAKLLNQHMHLSIMALIREVKSLAYTFEIPLPLAFEAIQAGSGKSLMLERFASSILSQSYSDGLSIKLAVKDLSLVCKQSSGVGHPFLNISRSIYEAALTEDSQHRSFASICDEIERCPSANDLRQICVAKLGVSGPSLGLI